MSARKDYTPISDEKLEKLRVESRAILTTEYGSMMIPASTVYSLAMELIDSREELFRLQICETVGDIVSAELDESEESLTGLFDRSVDLPYGREDDMLSDVLRPASPNKSTERLPIQGSCAEPSHDHNGRRLPRIDG